MKNLYVLFFLVLLVNTLYAQDVIDKNYYLIKDFNINELTKGDQKIVDSCLAIFHNSKEDTNRIKVLSHICDNLIDNSWTKFQVYNYNFIKKNLDSTTDSIARKAIVRYLVNALNNLSIMEVGLGDKQKAIDYCAEGIKLSTETSYQYGIAKCYSYLGYIYIEYGELEKSLINYKKGNVIYESLDNYNDLIDNLLGIAQINESLGYSKKAIKSFEICLKHYKKTNNQRLYTICNNSIALIHTRNGNLEEALKIFSEILIISNEIGDIISLSTTHSNIGDIYSIQEEYEIALNHYNKGLKIARTFDSKNVEAICLNNIANIYTKKNDFDNALNYYNSSLEIELETQNKVGVARCYQNLGKLYNELGRKNKAIEFSRLGVEIYDSLSFQQEIAHSNVNLAELLFENQNISEAKKYAEKGFNIASKLGYPSIIQSSAHLLSKISENEGNYKTALQMHLLYIEMKDSLINIENKTLIIRKQIEYEQYEKTSRLEKQTFKNNIKLEKQKNKIREQNYITALLILLIITITLLVFWRRSRYKLNIKWLQEDIFKSQMKPHFLFNVLVSIQSLIVQKRNKDAIQYLSEIASFMRSNLNVISIKKISIEEEIILATQYLKLEKLRFKDKLEFEIINNIESTAHFKVSALIIQPLIENAIVHGFKNIDYTGKIIITCLTNGNCLQILIEDNGVGFNPNKKENGKGLMIVEKRLALVNSKNSLMIEQKTNKTGVRVTITINP
ncbi:MAG: tetratricopeptide repeat protein [Flavobacteriales bacterium]|nr:tetratricopeptide repeat protein [Flavobacteriales bacterium]